MHPKNKKISETKGLDSYTDQELAEALIFPVAASTGTQAKFEDAEFWNERRKKFAARNPQERLRDDLLRVKFQLEDYLLQDNYESQQNFAYFLSAYARCLHKADKQFATELDIKSSVLSQYLNNHRRPPEKFVFRLEQHSEGVITARSWYRLLQKDKEHELLSNINIRREESRHISKTVELNW